MDANDPNAADAAQQAQAPAQQAPPAIVPPAPANAQLATALANIASILQVLQAQSVRAPSVPVLQHYDASTAFDLSTRSGASAYEKACTPLSDKWDGSIDKLPNFIIALMTRASESKWDATPPHGILIFVVGGKARNILTDYHSIPLADIEAAVANRADPRAQQNARCFYHCIKSSLEGDIRETIFDQLANLPSAEDGATLFKKMTSMSMASSLQLTIQTVQQIQALEPSDFDYKISSLNTRLIHLFMLASSVNRTLEEEEKLQHTLTIYAKIKQPEPWAQWVRAKIDDFDDGKLSNCQTFMNSAVLKQTKIKSDLGDFRGRSTTMQEDVVAMLAARKRTNSTAIKPDSSSDGKKGKKGIVKLPPFVRHFKATPEKDSTRYVLGDTKLFEGTTYYFCGCPRHRSGIKWHTHTPESCETRKQWLADGGDDNKIKPTNDASAHPAVEVPPEDTSNATKETDLSSLTTSPDDVLSLLATALTSVGDNPIAKELIADALSVLQDA